MKHPANDFVRMFIGEERIRRSAGLKCAVWMSLSHSPEEWKDIDYIAQGAEALVRALMALDKEIL